MPVCSGIIFPGHINDFGDYWFVGVTPCMKPLVAIKKLANEAAFASSYSATAIGYPVIKIGAGYCPSKQCFVIIPNVIYFGYLCPGVVLVLRLE